MDEHSSETPRRRRRTSVPETTAPAKTAAPIRKRKRRKKRKSRRLTLRLRKFCAEKAVPFLKALPSRTAGAVGPVFRKAAPKVRSAISFLRELLVYIAEEIVYWMRKFFRYVRRLIRRRKIPELVLTAVFVFSAVSLAAYGIGSLKNALLYRSLAAERRKVQEQAENDETAELPEITLPETPAPEQPEEDPGFEVYTGGEEPEAGQDTQEETVPEEEPLAIEVTEEPAETETAPEDPSETPEPLLEKRVYHKAKGEPLPEMVDIYSKNFDFIGWISIEDLYIDLPVVYKDNSYYLTHDYLKNRSKAGSIFLDENHPFTENAQVLLLHGHNMKDGSMFGHLIQYRQSVDYVRANAFLSFDTLWDHEKYVIFAVDRVSLNPADPSYFDYYSTSVYNTESASREFISNLMVHSMYAIPIDVQTSDAILLLSTCIENDRLVIAARKFREGEAKSELKHLLQLTTRQ